MCSTFLTATRSESVLEQLAKDILLETDAKYGHNPPGPNQELTNSSGTSFENVSLTNTSDGFELPPVTDNNVDFVSLHAQTFSMFRPYIFHLDSFWNLDVCIS